MQGFKQALPRLNVSFNMIGVKGGFFEMGGGSHDKDSLPVHPVELSDYRIGQYTVTQEVWEAVMGIGNNKSHFRGKQRPVDNISWKEIDLAFLPKLNYMTQATRPAGTVYRLPSESQWEFAARGGKSSNGFDFSGGNKLDDVGWYSKNSHNEIKPVGLKLPNELGLYDMSGNVFEWCRDWYGADYYAICKREGIKVDPPGPDEGDQCVLRGGTRIDSPQLCCVSSRVSAPPSLKMISFGFRLVLLPLPDQ